MSLEIKSVRKITEQSLIDSIAEKWKTQNFVFGSWVTRKSKSVYESLKLVKTVSEIEDILGNKTGTTSYCDMCLNQVYGNVVVFEQPNGVFTSICEGCLRKGLEVL